jgi:hypothetical protein
MAARIPVKAIYSGSDVTSLGEFTSSDTIAGSYLTDGSVTAAKLAADTATQAELDVVSGVANAALPKAGGTMTGNLVMGTNLVDGIDISARDAILTSTTTTAGAALPKAGGTLTGAVIGSTDTDASNTGNVTLDFSANQNFVLTLQGATTLVNPSTETVGQSGFITFIQDGTGGRVVSLGTDYETAGAAGITLSTAASATDIVPYVVVAANRILLGTPQLAFA